MIGSKMNGGNSQSGRVNNDFYPTPAECVLSLCAVVQIPLFVWEPACGDGAISKVLTDKGHFVISTDLHDYGYGDTGIDFLTAERSCNAVITNPPFKIADKFIERCFELEIPFVAMILKAQYFHAVKRADLFERHRPSKILAMTWRPDFLNKGAPTMDCIWSVWERGDTSATYSILRKLK